MDRLDDTIQYVNDMTLGDCSSPRSAFDFYDFINCAYVIMLKAHLDPRPAAIIQKFNLTAPQFSKVACYGHFGSNAAEMPWEQTDIAQALLR